MGSSCASVTPLLKLHGCTPLPPGTVLPWTAHRNCLCQRMVGMPAGVSKCSDVMWCPVWLAGLRLICGPGPALTASRLHAVTAHRQMFRAQSVV